MLRPWNWPTAIPAVSFPEEQNPKRVVSASNAGPTGEPVFDVLNSPVVAAGPLPAIVHVRAERLTSGADGSYEASTVWVKGSLALYRNGLRQMPGLDYVEERDSKRIVPLALFSPTDLVLVDYEKGATD